MKKIVILQGKDNRSDQLAHCLEAVFPECDIHVLTGASSASRQSAPKNRRDGREKGKKSDDPSSQA